MSCEERGPAGVGEAKDSNNSKFNITPKINKKQEIIQLLVDNAGQDAEVWQEPVTDYLIINLLLSAVKRHPCLFETVHGHPFLRRSAYLRKFVDLTTGAIWVRLDAHLNSIWFGANWGKAVATASEISKQNHWAFRHDEIQRCLYFGRAYPKQIRSSTSDPGSERTTA